MMVKTGRIEPGVTPCIMCGGKSAHVDKSGDAICTKCTRDKHNKKEIK